MKKTVKAFAVLLITLLCFSLSGCWWSFFDDEPEKDIFTDEKTEHYKYEFNMAGSSFAFLAEVTEENGKKSAEYSFTKDGVTVDIGADFEIEGNKIEMFDAYLELLDNGKMKPLGLSTDKEQEVVYSHEMLAGAYTPSHTIYDHSTGTTLNLNTDGTASIFDSSFKYYPLSFDSVVLLNAENKGMVVILDYSEKSFELVTKSESFVFSGGEYIESYYDLLYDCEVSYEGVGSFAKYTVKVNNGRYYLTDSSRVYVLGEAETSDNGIILCDFGDSDVEIQLDYEKLTFDNAIERRFENGNYYINIYTDGSVYASTVYVNGECRIVCELGEGRVPALYHVPTDKTFVFDDELNDVASFDGENYVDLSTAVTYTDIIAGSYGTNGRIMLANGSIYQVEYNYHGCAEYSLDTSAQMVSDNLILVNSRYYFLLGDEYFALWGYQLGSISSSNAVSSVVARGSVGVYEESGNAYVDDKLTQKENAYYAVVVFEDNSVLAVVAWVAPSELYGETVEFIKLGGALVYADGGLAVFNEKNGITFVELGEDSVYARRTYYALSGAELVRQTNTNYYIKSGSKYYEFDVEFAFVRELTEQEFSQLSSD